MVVAVVILELIGAADFFSGGYQVSATFNNVQELKKGDQVKMAGVEIGRVENIALVASKAEDHHENRGQRYEIRTDSRSRHPASSA